MGPYAMLRKRYAIANPKIWLPLVTRIMHRCVCYFWLVSFYDEEKKLEKSTRVSPGIFLIAVTNCQPHPNELSEAEKQTDASWNAEGVVDDRF